MHGQAMVTLSRIMPACSCDSGGSARENAVRTYDRDHESPELIWNRLQEKLFGYMQNHNISTCTIECAGEKQVPWNLAEDFKLRYPGLAEELFVEGVFIKNFLKDPKYALREPRNF